MLHIRNQVDNRQARVAHTFVCQNKDATSVYLAGNFNHWLGTDKGYLDLQNDYQLKRFCQISVQIANLCWLSYDQPDG